MRSLLCAALAAASLAAHAQGIEPGEWQFTTTMSSPMLPKPQTTVVTQCVTPEDAADPARFTAPQQAQGCIVTPGAKGAGSYSWTLSCPSQGMRGSGTMHYGADAMRGEMRVSVVQQGQTIEMETRTTGRRLGPCR